MKCKIEVFISITKILIINCISEKECLFNHRFIQFKHLVCNNMA